MSRRHEESPIIRPQSVALSRHAHPVRHRWRPATTTLAVTGTLVLLLGVALWVVLYLPDRVEAPTVVLTPVAPPQSGQPARTDAEAPPPYEATQRERARGHAQASLSELVELQIQLEEDMHVANWGQSAFEEALLIANEGDRRFMEQQYDAALTQYDAATAALAALVARGERRFASAIDAGHDALQALDANAARAAFTEAAAIYPDAAQVADGMRRAQRLPDVLAALREADRAQRRNDPEAALAHLEAARGLDPQTPDIAARIDELGALLEVRRFEALLSDGYEALSRGDYRTARTRFEQALQRRPGDAAAQDGQRQVAQAETLARIESLRGRAERHVAAEEWQDAYQVYDELLEIDATLRFAREGRAQSEKFGKLHAELDAVMADPGRLSSPTRFREAVALFQRSVDIPDPGPRLDARIDELEALLAVAAEPIPVTFTSDGDTAVTVSHIGEIGKFEHRTIELRPGRYLLIGSREGCRDVRREVTVGKDSAPIDIRCVEQI